MWDLPRDQLWMALPCWEQLRSEHAALLDQEGLRLWLAILVAAAPTSRFPATRFFFLPDEASSSFSCSEGCNQHNHFVEVTKTHARLQGEWRAEFAHGLVLSLGTGTMVLTVEESGGDAARFGQAQRGIVEFNRSLSSHAWISRASAQRFFDLTGQTVLSGRTTIELTAFFAINAISSELSPLLRGPRNSLAFGEIGLVLARPGITTARGNPALFLRSYGPRKLEVIRLLMRQLNAGASEVLRRLGTLAQPFQVSVSEPDDIGSLLDLADNYAAAGAEVYVGAAVETLRQSEPNTSFAHADDRNPS